MAQITDLTFQQLETASGIGDLFTVHSSWGLVLRLEKVLNLTLQSKNAPGVVESLYKLREYAALAQINVNQSALIGERLAAFPQAQTGTAVNGYVISIGQIVTRTPLSLNGILGANN